MSVSLMRSGTICFTLPNAWLSVTTSFGGVFEAVQHARKLFHLRDRACCTRVQNVADGLHLRQNHAAFRRGGIDGRDEHHVVAALK